jgi:hypothetical protein
VDPVNPVLVGVDPVNPVNPVLVWPEKDYCIGESNFKMYGMITLKVNESVVSLDRQLMYVIKWTIFCGGQPKQQIHLPLVWFDSTAVFFYHKTTCE